jgi:DNA primase catalytic subunit
MEQKEERIRKVAPSYYSRKDVLNVIFEFSKNREISPRYFEGFGKRPDSFQYPSDISAFVKRGATSFHCSEEHWQDPFQISTDLNQEQMNSLRIGWDLVIDIDCKWIEYSKKAAIAIIKALEFRGVKNILVKFSGSKGFHIIIPKDAFPEEINGVKVSNMFPDYPKAIVLYLKELSRPILEDLIKDSNDFAKVAGFTGVKCERCSNIASENFQITLKCSTCYPPHTEIFSSLKEAYKEKKCPNCGKPLKEIKSEKFFVCNKCNINSLKNKNDFHEGVIAADIFKILGLDLQLVSSRHLFRMPYSLHEKTALVSIPISKEKVADFQLSDADPFNITVFPITLNPKKDEARELLIQAIDWYKTHEAKEKKETIFDNSNPLNPNQTNPNNIIEMQKSKLEKINISTLNDSHFPPTILKILSGMEDGRKRGLFILLNFFRSLGFSMQDIEKKLNTWNQLNQPPLKQGYIDAQLKWHARNKIIMPPNFDNDIYKELGILELDELSKKSKNPVSYVIRKALPYSSSSQNYHSSKQNKKPPKPKTEKTPKLQNS